MKISASYLSIKDNLKENILALTNNDIDYLHLDVMDGEFVLNKTNSFEELKKELSFNKPFDVHLMVKDVYKYVDLYKDLKSTYGAEKIMNLIDTYLLDQLYDETTDEKHLPAKLGFSSVHKNCMHACGHDSHACIGLGTAKILMA